MGVREIDRFLEQWQMDAKALRRRMILAPTPRERERYAMLLLAQGLHGALTCGVQSDFVVTFSGGLFGLFGPLRPAKRAARLSCPWWVVLSCCWSSKRD